MGMIAINADLNAGPNCPLLIHFSKQKTTSVVKDVEEARVVAADAVKIPSEIWMTFTFTLGVGAFLIVGGIFLIHNGSVNNVTDFVVLGSCGSLVGLCFSSVGTVILVKSLRGRRKEGDTTRQVTQVQGQTNRLLVTQYFSKGKTRVMALQKTDQVTNSRPETVDSPDASETQTAAKTRNYRIFMKSNAYEHLPTTSVSACDTVVTTQPVTLLNKVVRTENHTVVVPKVQEKNHVTFGQSRIVNGDVNQKPTYTGGTILRKPKPLVEVIPVSVISQISADSRKKYNESLTVVVAEVHAPPESPSPTLFHHPVLMHPEFDELFQPYSMSLSDEEDAVLNSLDIMTGDSGSRPDTGVGESISEEEYPFGNNEQSFRYRVDTEDNENSHNDLMSISINDPFLYSHNNGVEHGYILNRCSTITEVLVHSG